MAGNELWAALFGAGLGSGGLALLVLAWRRRRQARAGLILGGWALLATAFVPWSLGFGVDKGVALGVIALSLAAFAVVLRNGATSKRGQGANSEEDSIQASSASATRIPWIRRTFVALLAGPVAAGAAMALGLAAFATGATAEADRLALASYLTPLAWGGLAAWAVSDPNLLRKTAGVIGLGLLGALAVIVHPVMLA